MALEATRNMLISRSTTGTGEGSGGSRAAAVHPPETHSGDGENELSRAPEIPLDKQRPNRLLFDGFVGGRGRKSGGAAVELPDMSR